MSNNPGGFVPLNFGQGNTSANPGYGNQVNAGFSPGQAGALTPEASKFVYQVQLGRQLDNGNTHRMMVGSPIFFGLLWTPFILVVCYLTIIFANALDTMMMPETITTTITNPPPVDDSVVAKLIGYGWWLLVWGASLYFIKRLTFDFWFTCLMLARRKGGFIYRHTRFLDFIENEPWDYADYHQKYPQ